MKDEIILLSGICIWAIVWVMLNGRFKQRGRNTFVRHLAGGTLGFVAALVFLIIALPGKQKSESVASHTDGPPAQPSSASSPRGLASSPRAQPLAASPKPTSDAPAVMPLTSSIAQDAAELKTKAAGMHAVVNGPWLACESEKLHSKITTYSVADDKVAFRKAATAAITNGDCTLLRSGERVQLMDTAIFKGMVQVRRVGDIEEYWTNLEAIK